MEQTSERAIEWRSEGAKKRMSEGAMKWMDEGVREWNCWCSTMHYNLENNIFKVKVGFDVGDDDKKVTTGYDTDKMTKGPNDIITERR